MYINFNLAAERGFTPSQVLALQAIKQNRNEDTSEVIETLLGLDTKFFRDSGLVTFIKGSKKDSVFKLIRLSSKGTKYLDELTTPEVTENDLRMFDYLCHMYLNADDAEGRTLGNLKLGRIYCAQFRQLMGLTSHEMYWLCDLFIYNHRYTKVLEYIFFTKKDNPYGKFKDNLESSKLYQFYQSNKTIVEAYWKEKIKDDTENR